ncbi:MAG: Hpt domain-containing protein, partial [Gammaproteobacteria bacterium]|nr:Hpt domain-containing protein [Gammaproteobacteria bacterium]
MMQTQTAARLAGEMEATATALAEGRIKDRDEAHEGLMRAILQIPDYLEWLQSGKPDRPQVLQPLIDDLRRARGEVVAAPALQAVATPEAKPDQEVRTLAGRVRPLYQSGLVHLLRDKPDADGTRRMLQALDMLARTCRLTQANRLWVLAGGHLESATHAGATLELTDKRLLGQIDREMKRLAEEGEHALEYSPNLGLLDNLTALLQAGSATGTRASAARKLIQTLKDAAPVAASGDADDSAADQSVLSGVNAQVLETVSAAIREDLAGIKDALDLYARSPHPDANDLAVLREPLRKIADTLNVIGLRSAHAVVADMGVVIKEAVESKRNLQDPAQLGLATAVLFVEAALNALSGGRSEVDGDADEVLSSLQRARDPDQADVRKVSYSALPDAEFQQVADAVMREAHIDIGRSKDAIAAFIDSPFDANILADTPELFDRISGALGLLGQTRAASLTRAVQVYLERRLLRGGDLPKRSELEDLADAISGIEYFLEAKQLKRRDAEQVLDVSEQSLKQLGYPFPEEDERPVEPDAEIDDDAFLADLPELDALTALSPTGSEFPDLPDIDDEGVSTDSSHPDPTEYSDTSRAEDLAWDTTGESLDDDWPHDAAIDDVTSGDIPVTVSNVPELEGEADPDILEIFLEEAGEERQRIAELLPAWRKNPEDMERVGELRRAYHTLKGSGRMVGAARLGEFAWGVEDLLNRVMDGAVPCDDRLLETITEASEHALPELIARLSDPDVTASADLDLLAAQLAALRSPGSVWPERGETSAAASISAEPVPPATADGQIQADEVIALDAPEMDAVDYEEPDSMPTGDDMVADLGAELIPDQGSADTDRDEEVISSGSDSPHSDDEDEDGPRLDPVLYDIFSKELLGHLDTLDDFVATTREQGFPGRPSAELRRALHTILGSTRTTGITELADLAGPLDTYIKDAGVNDESLTDADVEIVSESSRLFRDSIAHINEPGFRFPNIGPVLDRISEAFAARAKARAEGPIDVDDETILGLTAEDLTENQHDETASEVDTDPTPEESVERLAPEPAGEADADTDAESGAQIDAAESGLADILDAQESLPDELLGDEDAAPATIDASPIASSDEPLSQSSENATTAAEFDQLEAFDPGGFDAPSLSDETLPDAQEDDQSSFDATVVESTDDQAPETEQFDPMSLTEALQDTAPELDAAQFADEEPPAEDVEAHAALDVDDAAEDLAAASTNAGHFVVDTDSDLLDLFLEESAEILDAAESDLTHLQRHPDDAATVASLQRGLHTLKGGARMVGLTPIGDLSHALETLFESMAGGKVQADDIAARLLNQCFDRLLTMSVEARSGYITSAADLTDAVDALTRGERPNLPLEVGESVSESRDAQHDESASVGVEMAEEAVPEDQDAPAPSTSEPATAQAEAAAPKEATGRQEPARGEQIRVRAEVLGNLVNLAGEVSIFRSRLEQQLGSFQFNITELDQTVSR